MDVYIENQMTTDSFLKFKIGSNLDISSLVIESDYNPIGDGVCGYNFFNDVIDVEVTKKNGLIHSFDILLRNQNNDLYLGVGDNSRLHLNKCSLTSFMAYLIQSKLRWGFESILSDKNIAVAYYSKLKMLFYFDCESDTPLSLIHISKM